MAKKAKAKINKPESKTKPKKEQTPSAIHELRLLTNKPQEKELRKLMELGRLYYNAMLGEAKKRLDAIRRDPLYQQTVALPKKTDADKKLRRENFKQLNKQYGFTNFDLQAFGTVCKNESKFLNQLGTHVLQKLSTRAFQAVEKLAFGKAKRVQFKRKGEYVSLEGKDNLTFLRYAKDQALIASLVIPCKLRKNDPYHAHMLKHRIKFCRLVMRRIGTVDKFFLQVVFEGIPYQKVKLGDQHTALDIGPSTIATVNAKQATLDYFCAELADRSKEIKRLQRQAARKLRLANPQNHDSRGAVKKGAKKWIRSKTWFKLKDRIADIQRRLAARRKQLHGIMINRIVRDSCKVSTEKLSYKAFQKMYGKSIGVRAPASFENRLKDRIHLLGGEFQSINTYHTRLSQTCICGAIHKKALSERMHTCPNCGTTMQRDLFSAFLALSVENDRLNIQQAKDRYPRYESVMNQTIEKLKALKKEKPQLIAATFGI